MNKCHFGKFVPLPIYSPHSPRPILQTFVVFNFRRPPLKCLQAPRSLGFLRNNDWLAFTLNVSNQVCLYSVGCYYLRIICPFSVARFWRGATQTGCGRRWRAEPEQNSSSALQHTSGCSWEQGLEEELCFQPRI